MIYTTPTNSRNNAVIVPLMQVILIVAGSNVLASAVADQTLRSVEVNAHGDVHTLETPKPAASAGVRPHIPEAVTMHTHEVIRQVPASTGKSNHETLAPSDKTKDTKETSKGTVQATIRDTAPASTRKSNHETLMPGDDTKNSKEISAVEKTVEPEDGIHLNRFWESMNSAPPRVIRVKFDKQPHLGSFDMWSLFVGSIAMMWVIDITVVKRLSVMLQDKRNILHILWWVIATGAYAGAMYLKGGQKICAQWADGYFMELLMNVDTFFVLTVIFAAWNTPRPVRQKPLRYGMMIAIPCRIASYVAMEDLVELGRAPKIILGFLMLVFSVTAWMHAGHAPRENDEDNEQEDFLKYTLVTWVGRVIPLTPLYKEDHFFEDGKATLLFFVMLCIEGAQVVFSFDSVSTKITVIPDVYIAATSAVFGMMTVRALYSIFDLMIGSFSYMQYGVSVILAFLGFKMMFPVTLDIPLVAFFLLILSVLLGCVVLSYLYPLQNEQFQDSPETWQRIQEFREREKPKKKKDLKRFGTCQGLVNEDTAPLTANAASSDEKNEAA